MKLEDIATALLVEVTASCAECGIIIIIIDDIIDKQWFACVPESPT